jgi:phosphatidylinositol alpha-mannosyltransferase
VRICVVVPYDLLEEGGVKRHAENLAEGLRQLGDDVTIMGAASEPIDDPRVHVFGGMVSLPNNGSSNRLACLTPPWRIRRYFLEQRFDVVHVHEPMCPALACWSTIFARQHTPTVGTFHAFSEDENVFSRFFRWWGSPIVLTGLDRAIAVSEPAARYARGHWRKPLSIIPNGVATERFAGPARSDDGGPVRLLFVGHWRDRRKGLPDLLDAYRLLRERGVAVTLDVVGQGPSGSAAPELPGVRFHGNISDQQEIAAHYRACDIFVAPSTGCESFGIVLLEAMAAGRPIVCTNIDGYREVVRPEQARMVAAERPAQLADAIADLAEKPVLRRRMGEAGQKRARQFDWSVLVERVRDEYLAAIEERRGPALARSLARREAPPDAIRVAR